MPHDFVISLSRYEYMNIYISLFLIKCAVERLSILCAILEKDLMDFVAGTHLGHACTHTCTRVLPITPPRVTSHIWLYPFEARGEEGKGE